MASPSNLNGSGDRRWQGTTAENAGVYSKRRLSNGFPIPVFVRKRSENNNNESRFESESLLKPKQSDSSTVMKEYLECSLCKNTCIESTSSNCGHKFCKECIEKWRRKKPVCPTCSSLITSVHRIYSDDLLIESHLDTLEPDLRAKFKEAQQRRLTKILEERKSRDLVKRMRRKLDESLVFLRCKSLTNLNSARQLLDTGVRTWTQQINFALIFGVIIGACFVLLANNLGAFTNFVQYIWLSTKKYNGVIPEHLLKDGVHSKAIKTMVPHKTGFEVIVDNFNLFGWIFKRN